MFCLRNSVPKRMIELALVGLQTSGHVLLGLSSVNYKVSSLNPSCMLLLHYPRNWTCTADFDDWVHKQLLFHGVYTNP